MEDAKRGDWADLVQGWQGWLDYTKTTAAKVSAAWLFANT
jgi:hypothetical protein